MSEVVESRWVHWIGDAPRSLHANGPASFEHKTRNKSDVTCRLCLTDPPRPTPPGYWLPDDIWQLINERINNEENE